MFRLELILGGILFMLMEIGFPRNWPRKFILLSISQKGRLAFRFGLFLSILDVYSACAVKIDVIHELWQVHLLVGEERVQVCNVLIG